jgi:AcrR family transcriptional regulator
MELVHVDPGRRAEQPSRREREREFRVRLILDAAEQVFARHGFQAASVEAIATGAEVAVATLYKLFGSKEAIFAALVELRQEEFLREMEQITAEQVEPRARVDRLIDGIFRHFERGRETFRIYLGVTQGFPWHIRSSLGERSFTNYQRFIALVAQVLRDGAASHAWDAGDPDRTAVAIVGAVNGLLTVRHTNERSGPVDADIRSATGLVARLLPPRSGQRDASARRRAR